MKPQADGYDMHVCNGNHADGNPDGHIPNRVRLDTALTVISRQHEAILLTRSGVSTWQTPRLTIVTMGPNPTVSNTGVVVMSHEAVHVN